MSRGFILAEVSIAYLIMALTVAALVPAFLLAIKAAKNTEKLQVAMDLSTELLEEVRMRKWDENATIPSAYTDPISATLGVDGAESASDKTTFNDIDDFNGWTENGARDPVMRVLAPFSGYIRTVAVSFVDANLAVSASATDFKRLSICTQPPGLNPVCLYTVVTNR